MLAAASLDGNLKSFLATRIKWNRNTNMYKEGGGGGLGGDAPLPARSQKYARKSHSDSTPQLFKIKT